MRSGDLSYTENIGTTPEPTFGLTESQIAATYEMHQIAQDQPIEQTQIPEFRDLLDFTHFNNIAKKKRKKKEKENNCIETHVFFFFK